MSRSTLSISVMLSAVAVSDGVIVGVSNVPISNCGVENVYASSPTRAITMNQGATEFMLALGLEGSMVGTAYLDDAIWPKYATAYANIPVLSAGYPDETTIMAQSPDFIAASYATGFGARYTNSQGQARGIFSNGTVGPCSGPGSEWEQSPTTCRPQLHAAGIGTYLFEDACEDRSLRPPAVTEETVYEELRQLGLIFGVDAQPAIDEMKDDFDNAAQLVAANPSGEPIKTVWLDCFPPRCCEEGEIFVGAGTGAPNMLMQEAGLTNIFADVSGNWACVSESDIVAASPDVIVVVDSTWEVMGAAVDKIRWLYNERAFCQLDALIAARVIQIPFSATTPSPRNGPAALDLAVAALHVRTGSPTSTKESGAGPFSPYFLQNLTNCQVCHVSADSVMYDDPTDSLDNYNIQTCDDKATCVGLGWGTLAVLFFMALQ